MTDSALPRLNRVTSPSGQLSRALFAAVGGIGRYARWSTITMWHTLRLLGAAAVELLTMVWFSAWLVLSVVGLRSVVPPFRSFRRNAERQRRGAEQREGKALETHYGPEPRGRGMDLLKAELKDPQRARDLDWHLVNPGVTLFVSGVPLLTAGVGGFILLNLLVPFFDDLMYYSSLGYYSLWDLLFVAVDFLRPDEAILVLGLLGTTLLGAPLVARALQKFHAGWARFMLSSRETELEERVEVLTETRKTALELQAAEIQRIERDLHDGAQAHLVSVGMTLTQVSRLMRVDPDAAEALLEAAKGDSASALKELRTLVRGIRPPVLADRGLADALRSLTAGLPIETTVISTLSHRPVAAVESALYFAVSELLANAVKHSAASGITVELLDGARELTVVVADNGIGGAEGRAESGGGIDGVRRRLEPFDGTVDLVSPVGGGTTATLRIPHPSH